MSEIIVDIEKDIRRLKSMVGSPDIMTRLEITERLATNCWYLSELVAQAHEAMSTAEFFYKSAISTAVATREGGVAKTEAVAKHENREQHKALLDAESLHQRYRLLLNAANTIIEQQRQSISFLKIEYGQHR